MKSITLCDACNIPHRTLIVIVSMIFFMACLIIEFSTLDILAITSDSVKSNTPVKHVIVISQGKRSFDNYFGTFPGANGLPNNLSVPFNPFPGSLQKFTLEVWFNTNSSFMTDAFLLNKGGIGSDREGNNMNYGIWMDSTGKITAGFETKDGKDYTVGSEKSYNDGKWHQVSVTYDGNSILNLYLDGNLSATNKTNGQTPDMTEAKPIRVGSNSFKPGYYFTGFIDDVRIWNRTLEKSEILIGYNNNSYNSDKQIAYSPFDHKNSKINYTYVNSNHKLKGLYLNGSTYQDLNVTLSKDDNYLEPFLLMDTKTDSPSFGEDVYGLSYNNGEMNGFALSQYLHEKDPKLVVGYYNAAALPFYWKFASEFVLADNFFASTMDTGLVNENYLYTGIPVDEKENISFTHLSNINRTIFDELEKNGIPWKIYIEDYDPELNQTEGNLKKNRFVNLLTESPRFLENKTMNSGIVDLDQYFIDLRNDDFPAVVYIVAPDVEENSPRDVTIGEEFITSLILALMKSDHWKDSAFIITYRESGGWYDHVKPPINNNTNEPYGFRVPAIFISPYTKQGFIDKTMYDASSVLKFIEYNYNLTAIGKADERANNMLHGFDFSQKPREPIEISNYIKDLNQEKMKNVIEGKTVRFINYVYFAALLALVIIGAVIFMVGRRKEKYVDK